MIISFLSLRKNVEKPMRIAHVINYYHEGFGYQENWLAAHQIRMGHEVVVLTSDHYFPFPNYDETMGPKLGERKVGIGTFSDGKIPVVRHRSFAQSIGPPGVIFFSIGKSLRQFQPDCIHLHGATNPQFFEVLQVQKELGYRVFVDSHQDTKVEGSRKRLLLSGYYRFWRHVLHRRKLKQYVSRFLPITRGAQDWMQQNLDFEAHEMTISPLGVDLDSMFFDSAARDRFRTAHNLHDQLVIVNAGKQYSGKRVDWVIDVAIEAYKQGVPTALVLVGHADSAYSDLLTERLERFTGRVVRLPFLDRETLRSVYSGSDVGIWPGIPSNTIQEAMACRCAVILPDDDIVGHLVNGNGLRESQNAVNAAAFLKSLWHKPETLNNVQERSQEIAKSLSWEKVTADLVALYEAYR